MPNVFSKGLPQELLPVWQFVFKKTCHCMLHAFQAENLNTNKFQTILLVLAFKGFIEWLLSMGQKQLSSKTYSTLAKSRLFVKSFRTPHSSFLLFSKALNCSTSSFIVFVRSACSFINTAKFVGVSASSPGSSCTGEAKRWHVGNPRQDKNSYMHIFFKYMLMLGQGTCQVST